MRFPRFSTFAVALASTVALAAATAGVLAARVALAPNPTPAENSLAVTNTPSATSTNEPTPAPTEPPLKLPDCPDVSGLERLRTEPADAATASPRTAANQGTVYSWHDGDATRRVVLQTDLVVDQTANIAASDGVMARVGSDHIVRRQGRHGRDTLPVFRSESGGGLMALPGGVLLVLDPDWDEAAVAGFFARNNISTARMSALGFLPNGFLIDTEPGFPSLDLANALAGQDGVVLSSPNWWREIEAK